MAVAFDDVPTSYNISAASTWREITEKKSTGVDALPYETVDADMQTDVKQDVGVQADLDDGADEFADLDFGHWKPSANEVDAFQRAGSSMLKALEDGDKSVAFLGLQPPPDNDNEQAACLHTLSHAFVQPLDVENQSEAEQAKAARSGGQLEEGPCLVLPATSVAWSCTGMRLYAGFGLTEDPGFDSTRAGVVCWEPFARTSTITRSSPSGARDGSQAPSGRLGQLQAGPAGRDRETAGMRARREAKERLLAGALPPSTVLETTTSVLCVATHPTLPAVVAAGGRSGEVYVWDTSRSGDPLVGCSQLDDYFHRDGIIALRWFQEASTREYLLLSASADGRINLWRPMDRQGPGMRVPVLGLRSAASGMVARTERRRRKALMEEQRGGTAGAKRTDVDALGGAGAGASAGDAPAEVDGFDFGDDGGFGEDEGVGAGRAAGDPVGSSGGVGSASGGASSIGGVVGDTGQELTLRLSTVVLPCEAAPLPASAMGTGPSGALVLGCEGGAMVQGYMSGVGARIRGSRSYASDGEAARVLKARAGARMRWDADAAWVATNSGDEGSMAKVVKAAERLATSERADTVTLPLMLASRPAPELLFPSPIKAAMAPHGGATAGSDASPFDRRLVLTGCQDGTLRISTVLGGGALVELEPEGAGRMVAIPAVGFSRVRPLVVACGSARGTVHVFDLYGLGPSAAACRLLPDGSTVSVSADGGAQTVVPPPGAQPGGDTVDVLPRLQAIALAEHSLAVLEGLVDGEGEDEEEEGGVAGVGEGREQADGAGPRRGKRRRAKVAEPDSAEEARVTGVAFSHAHRKLIASCDSAGRVRVWRLPPALGAVEAGEERLARELGQAGAGAGQSGTGTGAGGDDGFGVGVEEGEGAVGRGGGFGLGGLGGDEDQDEEDDDDLEGAEWPADLEIPSASSGGFGMGMGTGGERPYGGSAVPWVADPSLFPGIEVSMGARSSASAAAGGSQASRESGPARHAAGGAVAASGAPMAGSTSGRQDPEGGFAPSPAPAPATTSAPSPAPVAPDEGDDEYEDDGFLDGLDD